MGMAVVHVRLMRMLMLDHRMYMVMTVFHIPLRMRMKMMPVMMVMPVAVSRRFMAVRMAMLLLYRKICPCCHKCCRHPERCR